MEILSRLSNNEETTFGCFVDGKLTDSNDYMKVIESSHSSVNLWQKNADRNCILFEVGTVLSANESIFQKIATLANPEQRKDIKKHVEFVVQGFRYYSRMATKYDCVLQESEGEALGCGILEDCPILPTLMWLTAAPLASGNTVVLLVKRSLSIFALCFAVLLHEAGLPSGVVNVMPFVDEDLYPSIACHLRRNICISTIKANISNLSVGMLMKIKSLCPMLVLKSADVDSAVDCFLEVCRNGAAFWFPNAIFVEEPLYERFIQCLKFVATKYNGEYFETSENQVKSNTTLDSFVNEQKGQGYEVIEFKHTFFSCVALINNDYALKMSTVMDESNTTHRLVSVLPVRTAQEGISFVNAKEGLAVSLWSNDASEVISIPDKLKYDTVWVNCADCYGPTIPLSLWSSSGYGTLGGKRALLSLVKLSNSASNDDSLYSVDVNSMYPKKQISAILKQSLDVQTQWKSLSIDNRLSFLANVAKWMEKNWNIRIKKILDETDESRWITAIEYVKFWSSYAIESVDEQIVLNKPHRVLHRSEPLGIIGIVTASAPLDVLMFAICAALAYGNAVVLGILNDKMTSVIAAELENIFASKSGLVSVVVVNEKRSLWKQFVEEKAISSIWLAQSANNVGEEYCVLKSLFHVARQTDMRSAVKLFEIHATKSKSVWYTCL